MYIIGKTNLDVVTIVSHKNEMELNQFLAVETDNGREILEIIELTSVSNMKDSDNTLQNQYINVLKLNNVDLSLNDRTLYVAKARVLKEQKKPIPTGKKVELVTYDEVTSFIIKSDLKDSIVLGQINGTEKLYNDLPTELKSVSPMFFNETGFSNQTAVPLLLSAKWSFEYPHTCYIGSSGSGKSHGLRVHCEEFMDKRIPSIFFDVHNEMDFGHTSASNPFAKDYTGQYTLCKIGTNVGIDFTSLNITELVGLLTFVADLTDPMKYALQSVYEPKDSFDSLKNRLILLKEAFENQEKPNNQRKTLTPMHEQLYLKYNRVVSGTATLQALLWRLSGLDKPTLFSQNTDLIEKSLKQRKFVVIQAANTLELKMFAYYILKKYYGKRRFYKENIARQVEPFPPFTIFFDEAHNFAPNTPTSDPIKSLIKELAQESRKYGVFLVTATQRPSLLDRTVMAQLNTKIIFRTTIAEDIEMVSRETNLTKEETKRLPFLTSGQGFILNPKFGRTLYIRFKVTKTTSPHSLNPFDELDYFNSGGPDVDLIVDYLKSLGKKLPDSQLKPLQQLFESELNETITILDLKEKLNDLALNGIIDSKKGAMGTSYFLTD